MWDNELQMALNRYLHHLSFADDVYTKLGGC